MKTAQLAEIVAVFGKTLQEAYGNDEYVIMVAAKRSGDTIHCYEMGESVKPEQFCKMAVECITHLYSKEMGFDFRDDHN